SRPFADVPHPGRFEQQRSRHFHGARTVGRAPLSTQRERRIRARRTPCRYQRGHQRRQRDEGEGESERERVARADVVEQVPQQYRNGRGVSSRLRYLAVRATPTICNHLPLTCIRRPTGSALRKNCAAVVWSTIATGNAVSSSGE